MTNLFMKLLVTTGLCGSLSLAEDATAAAEPRVIVTSVSRAPAVRDHRRLHARLSGPEVLHRPTANGRLWHRSLVVPQEHLRPRLLAARVTKYLTWTETQLVPYVRGPMSHRREVERAAQELLADAAASAAQRQMAEQLLARLRTIPPVIVVE